ncbi:MAG TPA: AAA family ATPase [Thermoanaerobaculia bacterium]
MTNPVWQALELAIAASPEDDVLRLHLATLLVDGGEPGRALEHCAAILTRKPDHAAALELTGRAGRAMAMAAKPHAVPQADAADETAAQPEPPAKHEPPQEKAPANVVSLRVVGGTDHDPGVEVEQSHVTLADVAGMEEVKRRLNLAFLAPMRNPEMRKLYGKSLRGGLLLYGPPGCGKTFIARATAGELGAKFIPVGLSDVLDMWLGQSERNLHEIFETARRQAPCVLFFDEIDALGRKRSLMRHSSERNVVNQLLAEMDSVGSENDGVFVLAATNHPWDVDAALRRPGRFDRVLLVLPPDKPARESIVTSNLGTRPSEGIDAAWLASKTEDFSGADLAHLVESAAELAMEESFTTGNARPIGMNDFKRALKELRPSTRTWFETARNYAQFANEGGVYDDLLAYMRSRRLL